MRVIFILIWLLIMYGTYKSDDKRELKKLALISEALLILEFLTN